MPSSIPPYKRLMDGFVVDEDTGCWVWSGSKSKNGYGQLKAFGVMVSAHRLSYELHKGAIPEEMEILHSCDRKLCVNPDHLRVGTHAANMREAVERGLMKNGKNHPRYGKKTSRPNQANKVMVMGVEYESQKSAERALGLGSGTVRYWIMNRPERAKIIELAPWSKK